MITCVLQGGLGNQMFQISAATAAAMRHGVVSKFNFQNHYLPLQGRKAENYKDNIFRNIISDGTLVPENVYREGAHSFSEIPYVEGDLCLFGYFQSEKYFSDFKEQIRDLFSPTPEVEGYLSDKYGKLLEKKTTSIHIRRGDYLKFSNVHPSCGKEYYSKAMNMVSDTEMYVIFSDDPDWCKDNFMGNRFYVAEGEEDYMDMYFMSKCKNNIIANSSFSWWAAWLNENPNKKVISPSRWFGPGGPHDAHDIIPKSWIRI